MTMSKLLKKLFGFLFPGIDGENDVPDPDDLPALDTPDMDDDDLPDLDDPADPAPVARTRRTDADDRLARLEAEVERRGRAAEAQRSSAPVVDQEFQREEERLRNPELSELERWQIGANRQLRLNQQQSQQALAQAHDMVDKTKFESKVSTDPRRAKYVDRVETAIQEERAAGRNASREAVYFYMLGKDISEGKLKAKAKTAPAVARGKPAGVRSDVQGRGRPSTERDKLRSRLESQNI
jgi:hypothetical protein